MKKAVLALLLMTGVATPALADPPHRSGHHRVERDDRGRDHNRQWRGERRDNDRRHWDRRSENRREWNRRDNDRRDRSEEHTSELQSLMRISYAVFCLKKKTKEQTTQKTTT